MLEPISSVIDMYIRTVKRSKLERRILDTMSISSLQSFYWMTLGISLLALSSCVDTSKC